MGKKGEVSKSYLRTDPRWNIGERSLASWEDFAQRPPNRLRNFPRAVNNSPVVQKQRDYSWNLEDISRENLKNAEHKRLTGWPIFLLLNLNSTYVLLACSVLRRIASGKRNNRWVSPFQYVRRHQQSPTMRVTRGFARGSFIEHFLHLLSILTLTVED